MSGPLDMRFSFRVSWFRFHVLHSVRLPRRRRGQRGRTVWEGRLPRVIFPCGSRQYGLQPCREDWTPHPVRSARPSCLHMAQAERGRRQVRLDCCAAFPAAPSSAGLYRGISVLVLRHAPRRRPPVSSGGSAEQKETSLVGDCDLGCRVDRDLLGNEGLLA